MYKFEFGGLTMVKRTFATKWEDVIPRDATGGFVGLDYTCPYCHYDNAEVIYIDAGNIGKIDTDFETDQVCKICGKDVIVVCQY